MKLRRYTGLIVGGSLALLFLVIALVLLTRLHSVYTSVRGELQMRTLRLNALNQRDPFPSEENVELAKVNLDLMQTFFTNLTTSLRADQVEPIRMEPAEFPPLLERTVRDLIARASSPGARVKLPDRFAFGFDRYLLGNLPAAEDIPRLVVQLKTMERICQMLFDAKISELGGIKRTVFEKYAEARAAEEPLDLRRRRAAPEAAEVVSLPETEAGGLYGRERFELRFSARESALWELLNRMASSGTFIVVVDLQLLNKTVPKSAAAKPAGAAAGAPLAAPAMAPGGPVSPGAGSAPPERPLSHDERVVAGRDLVDVKLVVDVYRFLVGEAQEVAP